MRRVPVFFMEIRSFAGKSMLLPQRIPSGARACMTMPGANKKAARRRQGITEIKFSLKASPGWGEAVTAGD